jgi:hypothetical protein
MQTTAAVSVIVTRVIAVKYHISIPVLKAYEDFKNEKENDRK